jgi:hypothetical protein
MHAISAKLLLLCCHLKGCKASVAAFKSQERFFHTLVSSKAPSKKTPTRSNQVIRGIELFLNRTGEAAKSC